MIVKILDEVTKERQYQNRRWGTILENPHEVGQWLAIMQRELNEAWSAYCSCFSRVALNEILQVIAVGVACLEQHGIVPRDDDFID